MSRITLLVAILLICCGCGPTQPVSLDNGVITVTGPPHVDFYLATKAITRNVNGKESTTFGRSDYGKYTLNHAGQFEFSFDHTYHGLDIVLVALNDKSLQLEVNAEKQERKTAKVTGKLNFVRIQFGYQPDPGSMFENDPASSISEAKLYLSNNVSGAHKR